MSIATKCTCHMSSNGYCNSGVKECTQLMSENKYPIGGYAPGDKPLHCTLTDTELAAKADQWIDELIASGGKSFTMQVPARPNADTDLIFAELNNRFKRLISEKPVGPVWVKASIRPPTGHSSDYHWRFAHNKKPINRNFHIESGRLIQEYGNTKGSYSLEELEWLNENVTASNKDVDFDFISEVVMEFAILYKTHKHCDLANDSAEFIIDKIKEHGLKIKDDASNKDAIDLQELWDEHSEYIDDDIDSLTRWAGSTVITSDNFKKLWQQSKSK